MFSDDERNLENDLKTKVTNRVLPWYGFHVSVVKMEARLEKSDSKKSRSECGSGVPVEARCSAAGRTTTIAVTKVLHFLCWFAIV